MSASLPRTTPCRQFASCFKTEHPSRPRGALPQLPGCTVHGRSMVTSDWCVIVEKERKELRAVRWRRFAAGAPRGATLRPAADLDLVVVVTVTAPSQQRRVDRHRLVRRCGLFGCDDDGVVVHGTRIDAHGDAPNDVDTRRWRRRVAPSFLELPFAAEQVGGAVNLTFSPTTRPPHHLVLDAGLPPLVASSHNVCVRNAYPSVGDCGRIRAKKLPTKNEKESARTKEGTRLGSRRSSRPHMVLLRIATHSRMTRDPTYPTNQAFERPSLCLRFRETRRCLWCAAPCPPLASSWPRRRWCDRSRPRLAGRRGRSRGRDSANR